MLAPEDLPGQHARVMRVAPASGSTPAASPAPAPASLAPPIVSPEQKVDKYSDDYASSSSDEDEPVAQGTSKAKATADDGWGVVQAKKKSVSSSDLRGVFLANDMSRARVNLTLWYDGESINLSTITNSHEDPEEESEESRGQESCQSGRGGGALEEAKHAQEAAGKVSASPNRNAILGLDC